MKCVFPTLVVSLLAALTAPIAFSQSVDETKVGVATESSLVRADSESQAIHAQSQAFEAAFNSRDAKAVAAFWTVNGEYVDDAGRRFSGREAIEQCYADFFSENPAAKIKVGIESVRILSPGVAIEDGNAVVVPSLAGVDGAGSYTVVHVKDGEKWLMASVRETWTETPASVRSAADLEWLIGKWVAEAHGVRTESTCRWVVEDRFLERSYSTTQIDGTKTSGIQLIGWNPLEGYVQSWDFSPDGGHAVGQWSPMEGGWQAGVRGTTGDGIPTAAVNVLRRLDENAYAWQSVQRSLGGVALQDTDEIIIKRSEAQ
jgi:uncharacterized protein (TIGR02246 family)